MRRGGSLILCCDRGGSLTALPPRDVADAVCEMIFISAEFYGTGVFFQPLEFTHRWRRYE
jgi:hypothetical protein